MPGLANVIPEPYVKQWDAYQAGDWERVREIQNQINEVSQIFDVTPGVVGYAGGVGSFKTALNLMGIFDHDTMPRPVRTLKGENREAIKKVLEENGLL